MGVGGMRTWDEGTGSKEWGLSVGGVGVGYEDMG